MEFNANSHHVEHPVTEPDCQICHAEVEGTPNHENASVDLLDPDQTGTTYAVTWIDGNRANLTASDIAALTTFCQNCHDDDGAARLGASAHDPFGDGVSVSSVGTHSNQDFSGVEADFSVGCIQCHTSHGSDNLALIHSQVVITPSILTGSVVFTAQIGPGSRDDGSGNGICVICHTHSSNPGHPMANHNGGLHTGWAGDRRSEDCSTCHPHEPDSAVTTRNGHMPADTNAVGLRGMLAQSGLWPILGLMGVLCAVVIEQRRHH
ncbi:MAG: hypothetical protein ACP5J4_03535 [Anaerolineae bacterium]